MLLFAVLVSMVTAAVQAAPSIPTQVGTAAGTVQAGTTKITLTHAYVSGPIGDDDPLYQIVLTDAPLPADAIDTELLHRGGQALLRGRKVNGIAILVDKAGGVRNIKPYVADLRGGQMLASAGRLAGFTPQEGRATGQGTLTLSQTMNQGWSYSASWNAAVRAPAK
jgi:hypothetical protein